MVKKKYQVPYYWGRIANNPSARAAQLPPLRAARGDSCVPGVDAGWSSALQVSVNHADGAATAGIRRGVTPTVHAAARREPTGGPTSAPEASLLVVSRSSRTWQPREGIKMTACRSASTVAPSLSGTLQDVTPR